MTLGKNNYFITFTDDYSRYTITYLIQEKSEAFEKFKEYKSFLLNQKNVNIKVLRTDNGGEYVSNEFKSYLNRKGIIHQLTPPYTPQRNGIAERVNQTILNKVRCMIKETNLEKAIWGEAVSTATNLKNKSPTKNLPPGFTCPFEVFWDQSPKYDKLRVFGSKVMIKINKKVKKLEDRAKEAIYLDYDDINNLYRVLTIGNKKAELTRDITFEVRSPRDLSKILLSTEEQDTTNILDEENREDDSSDTEIDDKNQNNYQSEESEESSNDSLSSFDESNEALFPREERYANNIMNNSNEEEENNINIDLTNDEENISERRSTRERKKVVNEGFKMYNLNSDPLTYKEAMESVNKPLWERAVSGEKKSLHDMNTWDGNAKKPPDQPVIKAKWLFKMKTNPDGSLLPKARLVAKGYSQIQFINYDETFSPVIRKESVRYLFSHAAANNLEVHHMDVETAFLNGELKEDVYMELPEGFGEDTGKIVKLKRSLYGLKQSPRCWYENINNTLIKNKYHPSISDPCTYLKKNEKEEVIGLIGLYVDDCLISGEAEEIKRMKQILSNTYKMKDLGPVKLILGMEIQRTKNEIKIYQRSYIREILERFNMSECKKVDTPIEEKRDECKSKKKSSYTTNNSMKNGKNKKMKNDNEWNSEERNLPVDKELYYQAVGCLNYLACTSRPDISYATSVIASHASDPRSENWTQVKRILRYLSGTINYSLTYSNDTTQISYRKIVAYSDASYAPNNLSRKSHGAYIFMYNGGAISWSSKRQSIIALSSCEAEYVALCEAAKESEWLSNLHKEINGHSEPTLIFEDNQSAIKLANNGMFSSRTKHIQVRFHYIRELITEKRIMVSYCPTELMVADALTKGLAKVRFAQLRKMMGLFNNS
jgi:hypothetical protein